MAAAPWPRSKQLTLCGRRKIIILFLGRPRCCCYYYYYYYYMCVAKRGTNTIIIVHTYASRTDHIPHSPRACILYIIILYVFRLAKAIYLYTHPHQAACNPSLRTRTPERASSFKTFLGEKKNCFPYRANFVSALDRYAFPFYYCTYRYFI